MYFSIFIGYVFSVGDQRRGFILSRVRYHGLRVMYGLGKGFVVKG